jgi:hypothetical protein
MGKRLLCSQKSKMLNKSFDEGKLTIIEVYLSRDTREVTKLR